MLWFNFILGLSFVFFCFKLIIISYHNQKQKKIKFKPRTIKLNHNIYNHRTYHNCNRLKLIPRKFAWGWSNAFICTNYTSCLLFFHIWKEGRLQRTLKGKERYVKGKATKRSRKDAFCHCKQREFSADFTMAVFMLEMFNDSVRLWRLV